MNSSATSSLIVKCPICKKDVVWEETPSRPFCSDRCRLIDLGSWASGDYRIPVREVLEQQDGEE